MKFKAFQVSKVAEKKFESSVIERNVADLPAGDVLIEVCFSSLNYKDALSAAGNRGVTREFPHTPGIDAAGIVVEDKSGTLAAGTEVIVTGFDLGMNAAGGFAEYIRVPSDWVVNCPDGLSLEESMVLGTAGLTAALCVDKLLQQGLQSTDGPVLVTGATGGVGILAVSLLAKLGYEVVASTGKADAHELLKESGAQSVIDRNELSEANSRPLLKEQWASAVDVVGGATLFNVIKALKRGGSVAACGLVQSPVFEASVLPFILRGVNLLGVDSVEIPLVKKSAMWSKLANEWRLEDASNISRQIGFGELQESLDAILKGSARGRLVLNPKA